MNNNASISPSLIDAVCCFIDRQNRSSNPYGNFDNGGRWYPSSGEVCICCEAIRSPSRIWNYSLMTHCRSAVHIATLFNVDAGELKKLARMIKNHMKLNMDFNQALSALSLKLEK